MKHLSSKVEEVVLSKKRKVIGIECDVCGEILKIPDGKMNIHYFRVTTGHHDWGNDSCDSIKHQDICPVCINKFVSEYLKNAHETSRYIEVETEHLTTYSYEYAHDDSWEVAIDDET